MAEVGQLVGDPFEAVEASVGGGNGAMVQPDGMDEVDEVDNECGFGLSARSLQSIRSRRTLNLLAEGH